MATGAANKAVQKWAEHDAKENIAKGLAPSKFDNVLNKVNAGAAIGSMFIPGGQLAGLGKAGSTAAKVGDTVAKTGKLSNFVQGLGGGGSGLMGTLGNAATSFGTNAGMNALDKIGSNPSSPQQPLESVPLPQNYFQPSQPSLSDSIFAGRQSARRRSAFA
jgi:hypothetical protein